MRDLPKHIHFIVGMSRGGTTFMSKVLNTHPDCVSFGETAFFGRFWTKPDEDGRLSAEQVGRWVSEIKRTKWGPRDGDAGVLTRSLGDDWPTIVDEAFGDLPDTGGTPAEVFRAFARAFCLGEEKTVAVEKTPHHVGVAERILEHVPDARLVVMLRDPHGFLRSYKHQGSQWGGQRRDKAASFYHPIPTTLIWRGYMRQALALQRDHPGRVLTITLDALRQDESATLTKVQEHLGLEVHELAGRVPPDNSSFSNAQAPPPDLTRAERFWLNRLAGAEMRMFGSDPDAVGLPLSAGWVALTSVAWLTRNFSRLRGSVRGSFWSHAKRYIAPGRRG